MKLISMREFVLHLRVMTTSELIKNYPQCFTNYKGEADVNELVKYNLAIDATQWRLAGEYAKFLSKPLSLSMFVSSGSDGDVMFEGFKICDRMESVKCVYRDNFHFSYDKAIEKQETIESLINYNLNLTPAAKKKIFG